MTPACSRFRSREAARDRGVDRVRDRREDAPPRLVRICVGLVLAPIPPTSRALAVERCTRLRSVRLRGWLSPYATWLVAADRERRDPDRTLTPGCRPFVIGASRGPCAMPSAGSTLSADRRRRARAVASLLAGASMRRSGGVSASRWRTVRLGAVLLPALVWIYFSVASTRAGHRCSPTALHRLLTSATPVARAGRWLQMRSPAWDRGTMCFELAHRVFLRTTSTRTREPWSAACGVQPAPRALGLDRDGRRVSARHRGQHATRDVPVGHARPLSRVASAAEDPLAAEPRLVPEPIGDAQQLIVLRDAIGA